MFTFPSLLNVTVLCCNLISFSSFGVLLSCKAFSLLPTLCSCMHKHMFGMFGLLRWWQSLPHLLFMWILFTCVLFLWGTLLPQKLLGQRFVLHSGKIAKFWNVWKAHPVQPQWQMVRCVQRKIKDEWGNTELKGTHFPPSISNLV